MWDVDTEEPIYNAIVWQDRRTSEFCDELKAQGLTDKIHEKTGLIIDAYFSGTKIKWILDNVPGARKRAEMGKLRFGNVDSWLVWRLTRGKVHVTDVTNASRTMLFNIHDLKWDKELMELLDIPMSMMPVVKSSSEVYGHTKTTIFAHEVPISGIAGDQQAALFGQMCIEPSSIKNTYGTGCFVMLNTGNKPVMSKNNLLTTIAWKIGNQVVYALEGSIYVGGSVVQWLRDGLGFITSSSEIEDLASTVPDSGGVYFVPALTGLAAPYWDQYARGTIIGITRGTTRAHIARAALDGIAFQTYDIAQAMAKDMNASLTELKVDGGASRNIAEEALYEYARRNYAGKKDAKSVEKFKLVDKMIKEDAISRERDRIKFLSGLTPEEVQRIGDDCFHEKYQNKFYPQMKALLANLRNYGFETWVISASPELLYQRFCVEELGFQEDRVIGVKSLVTMSGVVTDQIVFPSPQDEGKAEVIRTFIKTRPLFAAGNSRGDMEMMNTSVGLKLILNPDDKTPQKVMGGKTVKQYWAADPNCITEYTRDVVEGNYNWACDEYNVKQNAATDVSTPAVVIY